MTDRIETDGLWTRRYRDGEQICGRCGKELENDDIRANRTGEYYCSKECARKDASEKIDEEA